MDQPGDTGSVGLPRNLLRSYHMNGVKGGVSLFDIQTDGINYSASPLDRFGNGICIANIGCLEFNLLVGFDRHRSIGMAGRNTYL